MSAQIVPFEGREPKIEIVTVTPAIAEAWLGKNTQNRILAKPHVAAWARDMLGGAWHLNGETIKFDVHGKLIDGQHRLHAVLLANTSVSMIVVTGLATDTMSTVDTGKKRKYSDVLQIRGETGTHSLAAIARRGCMWDQGQKSNTGNIIPTNSEMDEWLQLNPSAHEAARISSRLGALKVLPPSVIGLCYILFARIDADEAEFFLEHASRDAEYFLEHGASTEDLHAAQPAFSLRKKVKQLREYGGRVNETTALAYTIQAWNSWRKGDDRHVYRTPKNGWGDNLPEPK